MRYRDMGDNGVSSRRQSGIVDLDVDVDVVAALSETLLYLVGHYIITISRCRHLSLRIRGIAAELRVV
jgi:hypothetical protein